MQINSEDLESQLDDIKKLTGLNLVLDFNSMYGGYLIYLISIDKGGTRDWHTSIRKSANSMCEYLNGILIGLEFASK